MEKDLLLLKTQQLLDLWKDFCQKHTELYDLTCEEYLHLLSSEIENLELTIASKEELIKFINGLDELRTDLILDISKDLNLSPKTSFKNLLNALSENGLESQSEQIQKMNYILLDIIEKIQLQNKKNQIFLNKALLSLNELKASFTGDKNYKTYSSTGGMASSRTTY